MEDLNEIEDFYTKQIEVLDKWFLEKSKENKGNKSLEKEYKRNLLRIKKDYEEKVNLFLKTHKSFGFEKEEIPKEEESEEDSLDFSKPFKATGVDFKPTYKDHMNENIELFKFKNKIKMKNFFNKLIPDSLYIFLIRVRTLIKRFFISLKNLIFKISFKVRVGFINVLNFVKNFFNKFFNIIRKISKLIKDFKNRFFKRKVKEGKGENNSDKGKEVLIPKDKNSINLKKESKKE